MSSEWTMNEATCSEWTTIDEKKKKLSIQVSSGTTAFDVEEPVTRAQPNANLARGMARTPLTFLALRGLSADSRGVSNKIGVLISFCGTSPENNDIVSIVDKRCDLLERRSPFDDVLDNESNALSQEINTLRRNVNWSHSKSVADRLEYLVSVSYDDDPDRTPIPLASIKCFANFFSRNSNFHKPNLVITPSKNIQAQWGKKSNKKLIVEFLSAQSVSFALFASDTNRPSKVNRIGGYVTTDMLMNTIDALNDSSWILE